jgi:colicin import membrane protein
VIELIRRYPKAFGFSLLLHVTVLVLGLIELSSSPEHSQSASPSLVDQTIKAEVIDQKRLDERAERIRQQQELEARQKREAQKKAEAARQREQEQKRRAEAERDKAAAEKKRQQAEAAAKRKQAEAEKKRLEQAVKKRKAEQEKQRREEEARQRAEAEQKRREEEARQKAEAERIAREEAERQAVEAARAKAEAEQRQRELELEAQIAAEERQRALNLARNKYYAMIRDKISRNWRLPKNPGNTPACEINVIQGPGGVILDVTFGQCPGTREYRLSVEAAVLKSDPLPQPEDLELFDRNINLIFRPE